VARDLADLMQASVHAREESISDLEPSAGALAGTVRAIRRRRAVRHSFQGVGAAAVALAVAGGSWLVLEDTDPPIPAVTPSPAVTPTPSMTPSPSVTPSSAPTPSATSTAAPVAYDEILGLPPTRPLPPGLLERSTPGWVLAVYQSVTVADMQSTYESGDPALPVVNTVVLVSPAGELYRVVDLPLRTDLSILRWEAGTTTAVVSVRSSDDPGLTEASRVVLDLTSGELTPTDLGLFSSEVYGNQYVGEAADGAELWTEAASTDAIVSNLYRVADDGGAPQLVGEVGGPWLLDPTGRWLVSDMTGTAAAEPLALLDVVNGGRVDLSYGVPGQDCELVGWLDPGRLLAFCVDPDTSQTDSAAAHAAYYRIDVGPDGATATLLKQLGASDPHPTDGGFSGEWAGSGAVAFAGAVGALDSECADDTYVWTGSSAVATSIAPGNSVFEIAPGEPLLVASTFGGCSGDIRAATLRSYDTGLGTSTVLAPEPATTGVQEWAVGLLTWVRGATR